MDTVRRGGKKNRKHGNQRKRPAQIRYTAERRWIKNKARKITRYMKDHPNWSPWNLKPEVWEIVKNT